MLVAALLFAAMALLAKEAAVRLPGPEVACLRFGIGVLAAAAWVGAGHRLRPRDYRALFLRGAFGGGAVLLYFMALRALPAGLATLLNYSSPIFTVLFSSMFLGEHLGRRGALGLLATISGVALVVHAGTPAQAHGSDAPALLYVGLGLGSAVLSGAAVTTIRSMRQTEGSWEIFLAFCLVGGLLTGVPTAFNWLTPTPREAAYVAGVGLTSVMAQICMTHALRDLRAADAGLIMQLTPVATMLCGAALLYERPSPLGLAGAALTLFGVSWGVRAG